MTPLAFRLLRRLRDPGTPLSRNRNLGTFESKEGRSALRTHRLLRSLERDLGNLEEPEGLRLRAEGGRVRLMIDQPALKVRREAILERLAFDELMASSPFGPLLRKVAERDAPELVPAPRVDQKR